MEGVVLTATELSACAETRVSVLLLVPVLLIVESAERVTLVVSFSLSLSSTSFSLSKIKVRLHNAI